MARILLKILVLLSWVRPVDFYYIITRHLVYYRKTYVSNQYLTISYSIGAWSVSVVVPYSLTNVPKPFFFALRIILCWRVWCILSGMAYQCKAYLKDDKFIRLNLDLVQGSKACYKSVETNFKNGRINCHATSVYLLT